MLDDDTRLALEFIAGHDGGGADAAMLTSFGVLRLDPPRARALLEAVDVIAVVREFLGAQATAQDLRRVLSGVVWRERP